ncbi:MAG: hypothetical protein ACYSWU_13160, partial [Planctomycetota bacterium]
VQISLPKNRSQGVNAYFLLKGGLVAAPRPAIGQLYDRRVTDSLGRLDFSGEGSLDNPLCIRRSSLR